MSFREEIAGLEALAAVDVELKRIDEAIAAEEKTLATMKAELKKLDDKLAADRARVIDVEKLRGEAITELRQMANQIDRSREKFARTRNEREQNAVQRELEELRRLQRDRDDEAQKLQSLTDMARISIADGEVAQAKITAELQGAESGILARLEASKAERAEKAAERAAITSKLPPVLFRRYDLIRAKRGTALAPATVGGTCGACHIGLPAILVQKVMRTQGFEQCPACSRILYFSEPAAPTPDPSEGA